MVGQHVLPLPSRFSLTYVVRSDEEAELVHASLERHLVSRSRRDHEQGLVVPRPHHHVLGQLEGVRSHAGAGRAGH